MRRFNLALVIEILLAIFIVFALVSYFGKIDSETNDMLPKYRSYEDERLTLLESKRVGPGEHGKAVKLSTNEEDKKATYNYQNGFNIYVSDLISLDRSVADIRHPKCKTMKYRSKLPKVSIIIPFFEEHLSTLLRTVISSLKRSPLGLVKEVILVDDGSTRIYLKEYLDKYIHRHFPEGLVKIVRIASREGLIRARIYGAKAATGEVLVFLDSHCEPNPNWLPPLLDPIARDYKTVTCPFIDIINTKTFQYVAQDEGARGAFDWELFYKRLPRLPEDAQHPELPFDSPIMAGGLFAISTKWFWELGGYDPGLLIWGGEQYELSFKIWMCGGSMKDIPCSRVGHLYRTFPTNFPPHQMKGDVVGRNFKRVAEVWMDEYKEYLYLRRPQYRSLDPGNLTEQYNIRKRLKCSTFKWFMTEIAFDLTKKYPLIEPNKTAFGDIRPENDQTLCIDGRRASLSIPVRLEKCERVLSRITSMQSLELTYLEDIRLAKTTMCLDVPNTKPNVGVSIYPCHGEKGNQHWTIEPVFGNKQNPLWIRHGNTGYCLEADSESARVFINQCNHDSSLQKWIWQNVQIEDPPNPLNVAGT